MSWRVGARGSLRACGAAVVRGANVPPIAHSGPGGRPRAAARAGRPLSLGDAFTHTPTMNPMLLAELTATSDAVREERARTAKIERLAEALRRMSPAEVAVGVSYL